jgi:hypothetical protein
VAAGVGGGEATDTGDIFAAASVRTHVRGVLCVAWTNSP